MTPDDETPTELYVDTASDFAEVIRDLVTYTTLGGHVRIDPQGDVLRVSHLAADPEYGERHVPFLMWGDGTKGLWRLALALASPACSQERRPMGDHFLAQVWQAGYDTGVEHEVETQGRIEDNDGEAVEVTPPVNPYGDPDNPEWTKYRRAVAALFALNSALGIVLSNVRPDDLTPLEAITTLDAIRDVIETLQTLDSLLVLHVYLHGEHGRQEIDGVGEVKVYRSRAGEKWEHWALARAVIDARMEARGGEAPDDPWEVVEWLLDTLAPSYWRKGKLRDLGVNPDPFYDSVPGKPKVDLPRRD